MVNQGDRVIVEYRGKLDDGTEFASTKVQGEPLPVGAMLGIQTPEGDVMRVRVLEVGDEEVVLDCNHELAGQNLNFDITLVGVVSETPIEHELHPEGCMCGCDRLQESLAAGE